MICSTYYDLAEQGFGQWWFLLLGLLMSLLGILVFVVGYAWPRERLALIGILLRIGGASFFIGWITISTYQTIVGYSLYQTLLQMKYEGKERRVQGIVTNFSPYNLQKYSVVESFELDGHFFSYSPNEIRAGFRQTSAKGSPIHNGVYLRVAYVGNSITQLEVCQPGNH
jgi:hypothetical protein